MTARQCHAMVKDTETGETRLCRNKEENVMDNGYCRKHQHVAIMKMIELLFALETEMQEKKMHPEQVRQIMEKMKHVSDLLQEKKTLCEADPECKYELFESIGSLEAILHRLPGGWHTKREIIEPLSVLAQSTKGLATQADKVHQREAFSNRLMGMNLDDSEKVMVEMQALRSDYEAQLKYLQDQLNHAHHDLSEVRGHREVMDRQLQIAKKAEGHIKQLEQRLSTCQEEHRLQEAEREAVKQSITKLHEEEGQLKAMVEELRRQYEKKQSALQEKYAQASANGELILSQREEELQQHVEDLNRALEKARDELKESEFVIRETKAHAESVMTKTHGKLAQEMQDVNAQLIEKTQMVSGLEQKVQSLRNDIAKAEISCSIRQEKASANDQLKIQELGQELVTTQRQFMLKSAEVNQLRERIGEMKTWAENRVLTVENELQLAREQLTRFQSEYMKREKDIADREKNVTQMMSHYQEQLDLRFQQELQQIRGSFDRQSRELKHIYEVREEELRSNEANLKSAEIYLSQQVARLHAQEEELNQFRRVYNSKLSELQDRKLIQDKELITIQNEREYWKKAEKEHEDRIRLLESKIQLQAKQFEKVVNELQEHVKLLAKERSQIQQNFQNCTNARQSLVQQIEDVTRENEKLRSVYEEVEKRYTDLQQKYESQILRDQEILAKQRQDLKTCAMRIRDDEMMHNHVKEAKAEIEKYRREAQEAVHQNRQNLQAIKSLLETRELSKSEITRLRNEMQACNAQQDTLKANVIQINDKLHQVQKWSRNLENDKNRLLEQMKEEEINLEARRRRELAEIRMKQNLVKSDLDRAEKANSRLQDDNTMLRAKTIEALKTTARSEVHHAADYARLADATMMQPTAHVTVS